MHLHSRGLQANARWLPSVLLAMCSSVQFCAVLRSSVQFLLHGDERYAFVSSRQRNTMTRAAWVTARLLLFPLSIYPVPRPARLLCAAPRLNLEVRTPLLRCSDLESRRSRGLRLLSLFVALEC